MNSDRQSQSSPVCVQLGFGCSNLGSDLGYRASCALVETAYEAGFRHFDVAPSYGHGHAERIIGDVLGSVRKEICLVTKAGIAHPRAAGTLTMLKRWLAPVKKNLPGLWERGARGARRASAPRGQFRAAQVKESIRESLKRLQTQSVDWLLLHDVKRDELTDETLGALFDARTTGQIRGIGLGATGTETQAILALNPGIFGMVQVEHFWCAWVPEIQGQHKLVTHRVIREGKEIIKDARFQRYLDEDPSLALLGTILQSEDESCDLLLKAGTLIHGPTHVLVSSSKPARVRRFMQVAKSDSLNSLAVQLNSVLSRINHAGITPTERLNSFGKS